MEGRRFADCITSSWWCWVALCVLRRGGGCDNKFCSKYEKYRYLACYQEVVKQRGEHRPVVWSWLWSLPRALVGGRGLLNRPHQSSGPVVAAGAGGASSSSPSASCFSPPPSQEEVLRLLAGGVSAAAAGAGGLLRGAARRASEERGRSIKA